MRPDTCLDKWDIPEYNQCHDVGHWGRDPLGERGRFMLSCTECQYVFDVISIDSAIPLKRPVI